MVQGKKGDWGKSRLSGEGGIPRGGRRRGTVEKKKIVQVEKSFEWVKGKAPNVLEGEARKKNVSGGERSLEGNGSVKMACRGSQRRKEI